EHEYRGLSELPNYSSGRGITITPKMPLWLYDAACLPRRTGNRARHPGTAMTAMTAFRIGVAVLGTGGALMLGLVPLICSATPALGQTVSFLPPVTAFVRGGGPLAIVPR